MSLKTAPSRVKRGFTKLIRERGVVVFVVVFAIVGGSILLLATHAASPYASINADKGLFAGGASIIADGTASDGNAVKFGSASTGGGGTNGNCPGLPNGTAAFCDTFNAPAGNGNRSGDLNGTVWGVSRSLIGFNLGQQQYDRDAPPFGNVPAPPRAPNCPSATGVLSPKDVVICNGQVQETTNDNACYQDNQPLFTPDMGVSDPIGCFDQGGVTSLAMYPKQPVDFTGTTPSKPRRIVFDVSDDSAGNHAAWPEFWVSDKPVPVPFTHFSSSQIVPQNGFGVRLAATCGVNSGGCGGRAACPSLPQSEPTVTVDSADIINNYISNDSFTDVTPGPLVVNVNGCVRKSSGPGNMNHFEVDVSAKEIDVCGTDAGTQANPGDTCGTLSGGTTGKLVHLATITNLNPVGGVDQGMNLPKGLIWMEDVHYNADKSHEGPNGSDAPYPLSQRIHTFSWDNVGFDGPITARDLAFDVLDSKTPVACDRSVPFPSDFGCVNLGWGVPVDSGGTSGNVTPLSLTTMPMTAANIANTPSGSSPILTFNYFSYNPVTMYYKVNSQTWQALPYPAAFRPCFGEGSSFTLCGPRTMYVPIPASFLQAGANTINFKSSDGAIVSNVDIILPNAGGIVSP